MRSYKKVFLGLENIAGIFSSLKKGFVQSGISADFYCLSEHIFGYDTDKIINYTANPFMRKIQKMRLIIKLLFKYDYFIFDSTGTLFPDFKDVKFLRFFGKKTMVVFTGCDIRLPEKVEKFKWNPCRNCSSDYKNFVGCNLLTKPGRIKEIEKNFDILVSAEEASGSLSKKFYNTLFPVDINKFSYIGVNPGTRLRILHAPSNPEYKGTAYINEAINRLRDEFEFEFIVKSNIKAEELYEEISRADLVIDQMLVGFYGLFSIESMSMGKPVVCYIREDILENSPAEIPVINANPDTLYSVLKEILSEPSKLIEIGSKSRFYAEKYHDASKIAKQYYELFEKE